MTAAAEIRDIRDGLLIELEAGNIHECRPLYVGEKARLATATFVRFLDSSTIVCGHLIGRKIYLIHVDPDLRIYEELDSRDTLFGQESVESDLCDADDEGNIVVSNCTNGFSQYRREGDRIRFVRDLPFNNGDFVHGVKFFDPHVVAVTVARGRTGVHFYDLRTLDLLLHVAMPAKTQDVAFLSRNRVVVLSAGGAPKLREQEPYPSTIHVFDFDVHAGTFKEVASRTYEAAHFDCVCMHDGKLYITDQYNDSVRIMDPVALEQVDEIGGYDFPHGIDIRYDMMAVTNYGTSAIHIRRL